MNISKLDFREIKDKYNYTTNELILHYGILSGEISNDLLDRMINPNTKINIFTRKGSKINGCFKYKKKDGVAGYQLLKQGQQYYVNEIINKKDRIISNDAVMQSHLYDASGKLRKYTTNDVGRRKTYQKLCKLYYMLDVLNINYLPCYRKGTPRQIYYSGRELNNEFAKLSNSTMDHRLRGTKIKGVIKFYNEYYNVFLYDNDVINLYHKEEIRIANDIRMFYENQSSDNIRMGTIIFCRDTYMQERIIKNIINSVNRLVNTSYISSENYNYFRDFNNSAGINIISFDETGEKQLYMLSEKEKINEYISQQFCKPSKHDKDGFIRCKGIICDGNLKDSPCYFLYSLDYNKISAIINNMAQTKVSIICLKEHYNLINNILKSYSSNYILLPII